MQVRERSKRRKGWRFDDTQVLGNCSQIKNLDGKEKDRNKSEQQQQKKSFTKKNNL